MANVLDYLGKEEKKLLTYKAKKLAAASGQMKKPAEPKPEPPAPAQEKK
jgi:hypothetical protein